MGSSAQSRTTQNAIYSVNYYLESRNLASTYFESQTFTNKCQIGCFGHYRTLTTGVGKKNDIYSKKI